MSEIPPRAIPTIPVEPEPTRDGPVATDASLITEAIRDAHRNVLRAQEAVLGNQWLSGCAVTMGDGDSINVAPGTVSIRIPLSEWAEQPSGSKLVAPSVPDSTPSNTDGAMTVTFPGASAVPIELGTYSFEYGGQPITHLYGVLVYLRYDPASPSKVSLYTYNGPMHLFRDTVGYSLEEIVPLAYVDKFLSFGPWQLWDLRIGTRDRPRVVTTGLLADAYTFTPGNYVLDPGAAWAHPAPDQVFPLPGALMLSESDVYYVAITTQQHVSVKGTYSYGSRHARMQGFVGFILSASWQQPCRDVDGWGACAAIETREFISTVPTNGGGVTAGGVAVYAWRPRMAQFGSWNGVVYSDPPYLFRPFLYDRVHPDIRERTVNQISVIAMLLRGRPHMPPAYINGTPIGWQPPSTYP